MAGKKDPVGLYILASALVIGLDQAFKAWVTAHIPLNASASEQIPLLPGVIHLTHIRNSGVAFGLLQGGRWAFLGLLTVFAAVVIWAMVRRKLTAPWERWLAVLALAGAIGNGIDRALHGYVVDMLEVEFVRFAVFNLADVVINVSCIAFVILTLFQPKGKSAGETGE